MLSKNSTGLSSAITIVTASVLLSFIFSKHVISVAAAYVKGNALVINLAKGQRGVSQQIVAEIAADNLSGITACIPIDTLAEKMERSHRLIFSGNSKAGITSLDSELIPAYQAADASFNQFFHWVDISTSDSSSETGVLHLMDKQETYASQMDKFVDDMAANAQRNIARLRRNEAITVLFSLAVIFVEVVLLLLPALRKFRISRNVKRLAIVKYTSVTQHHLRVIKD